MAQTWTQQRQIKFSVAHVSFVRDPVSVVQYSAQLFQQTSISPGISVVLVSTSFGRDCWLHKRQERWNVCSRTCQVTNVHPFPWSAELRSLHTCREPDVVPCCVRDAITLWCLSIYVRSWTLVHSCAVATTGDFLCRIPKSARQRHFIVY